MNSRIFKVKRMLLPAMRLVRGEESSRRTSLSVLRFHWLPLFLVLLLTGIPPLRTAEIEPLSGGAFTEDLTVQERFLGEGEPLSLDEATRLALVRNLDIEMARLANVSEGYENWLAGSVYDTDFEVWGNYLQDQKQEPSIVFGNRQTDAEAGVAFEKLLPTGTDIRLEGVTSRESTNSAFVTLSRYYESYGKVSFVQPLLRNAFGYADRKRIRQVKLNVRKFDYETLDRIESYLYETRLQYWDLQFAFENLRTRRKALRKAQDFFQITRDKLDLGLTEKPDVFAAEANVRKRVLEVWQAENELQDASHALRVLLNLPEIELIRPSEKPGFDPVEVAYEQALEKAFETRRDLRQLELALESQKIETGIRANGKLPILDFEGSYASTGLDRDMANSQGETGGFNHPQYYAGFRFSTSLENREKEALLRQAKLEMKRLEKGLQKAKLQVGREMDAAYRALLLASERVRQSRQIEQLQHDKLLEEEKNFNRGRSSSKTIIDFQEDLIEAEIEAVRALIDYRKTVDNFYRTSNLLLEQAGVAQA